MINDNLLRTFYVKISQISPNPEHMCRNKSVYLNFADTKAEIKKRLGLSTKSSNKPGIEHIEIENLLALFYGYYQITIVMQ